MKKIVLILFVFISTATVYGQAAKYLNLGGIGTGLYVGYEIPLGSAITIQPFATTDWNFNKFIISVKGNYYFDNLFGVNSDWDVYAGANVGWRIDNGDNDNSGAAWGGQIGARWFWSEKWGLNAEFGGGSGVLGGLGVTMKM